MVDCFSGPGLTPFEDALEQLLVQVRPTTKTQMVSLNKALGCVLSQAIVSPMAVPSHDNSAMDGYAVRSADVNAQAQLNVIAKVFAGHPYEGSVGEGQCVRVMTGGQIPDGCDAVVMQENVVVQEDGRVACSGGIKAGNHVRRAGEDIEQGATVLSVGRRLTPSDIGLLASLGIAEVPVYEPLTVAVISTGDELQKPGVPLEPGQMYESNGYTVSAILERLGVNVVPFGIVPDELDALRNTFSQADDIADVVISSGGVSVGEADYTKQVLEELGRIDFWKLAMKPGKPFAFGHLPSSYFIGLPGNPVSAMVTLHQLAVPLLRKIRGESPAKRTRLQAKAMADFPKRPGRTDFQRGVFSVSDQGELVVVPTGAQGSGILTSLSLANCYVIIEQDRGTVTAGEAVTIEPFDSLLG